MAAGHIITGAALVGAGAMAPLWLPFGPVGGIALLGLMRICWLEDNIISDLFGRDRLPTGYRNTARSRRLFVFRWFGIWPEESTAETLRASHGQPRCGPEVQIWGAMAVRAVLRRWWRKHGPFGPVPETRSGAGPVRARRLMPRGTGLALTLRYSERRGPAAAGPTICWCTKARRRVLADRPKSGKRRVPVPASARDRRRRARANGPTPRWGARRGRSRRRESCDRSETQCVNRCPPHGLGCHGARAGRTLGSVAADEISRDVSWSCLLVGHRADGSGYSAAHGNQVPTSHRGDDSTRGHRMPPARHLWPAAS